MLLSFPCSVSWFSLLIFWRVQFPGLGRIAGRILSILFSLRLSLSSLPFALLLSLFAFFSPLLHLAFFLSVPIDITDILLNTQIIQLVPIYLLATKVVSNEVQSVLSCWALFRQWKLRESFQLRLIHVNHILRT